MRLKPLLAATVFLSACTVGPDYHAPIPKTAEQWQQAPEAARYDTAALQTWWRNFGDAELERLIQRGLDSNLDLAVALSRIEQARAEHRAVRADFFPRVNIAADAHRYNNPFPGFAPNIKFNLFELGFDALWEIDLFGRLERRQQAAQAEWQAAQALYQQAGVVLSAETARLYLEYRGLQQAIELHRRALLALGQLQTLAGKLYVGGVATRSDALQALSKRQALAAQLPPLEAALVATQHQLETLLGAAPGALAAELETPAALPRPPAQLLLSTPADTLRRRPDIAAAERQLAAASALHAAAVAELFPKVSLSAFLGLRNTDLAGLLKNSAFSWSAGAGLLQPLLDFGRIRAGIDLAQAREREAYLTYEKTVLEALAENETALIRYLKEERRNAELRQLLAQRQEMLVLSERRQRAGVVSRVEVLQAAAERDAAELDVLRSQTQVGINLIAVYKALGGHDATPNRAASTAR